MCRQPREPPLRRPPREPPPLPPESTTRPSPGELAHLLLINLRVSACVQLWNLFFFFWKQGAGGERMHLGMAASGCWNCGERRGLQLWIASGGERLRDRKSVV